MKYIFWVDKLIVLGALITMVTCSGNVKHKCVGCDEDGNEGKCDKRTPIRVLSYVQKVKCEPRPSIVKLHATAPHFYIKPDVARVNRCSGYCDHFKTCLPTKSSQVIIPVMLMNRHDNSLKCVKYHVEQHDECACDCAPNQMENQGGCDSDMGFVWDPQQCRCVMMMMPPSDISENLLY